MKIYLASKSPRRQELLRQIDVEFELLSLDVPEEVLPGETAVKYSKRITREKSLAAWNKVVADDLPILPVLCADTEVVVDQHILGKPCNYADAYAMLKAYSGRSHEVITSIGLKYTNYEKIATNITTVHFSNIPDEEIHKYLVSNDYMDKSGGYAIQSYIGQFISSIDGCFYSVMGLPLNTVRELLLDIQKVI